MADTVPFHNIVTGDPTLDRIQNNVSQFARQIQNQAPVSSSLDTAVHATVGRQSVVNVISDAIKSVVISLPLPPPQNQVTRINNQSKYPVKVRTTTSETVFEDIAPGGSATLNSNGKVWSK